MGYTHYYTLQPTDDPRIDAIGDDIRALVDRTDVPVANGLGEPGTEPTITSEGIMFNGVGPDRCETFVYPPGSFRDTHGSRDGFEFCKTRQRPYGQVVAAAFLVIKFHMGDQVSIGSDGDIGDREWSRAIDLFQATFPDRDMDELLPLD